MLHGKKSMVTGTGKDAARNRTSNVQIAENEASIFPSIRRMSKSVLSDTGSSVFSMRRSIIAKPRVEMENSYRAEPILQFPSSTVSKRIQKLLDSRLSNSKYEHDTCKALCNQLSDAIKDDIRREIKDIHRYKLICCVAIGQVSGQDVRVASRCLWNVEQDRCSTASFTNQHLFVVATLHAIYYEGCHKHLDI